MYLQTHKNVAVQADTEGKIQPIDSGLAVFPCHSQNHKDVFLVQRVKAHIEALLSVPEVKTFITEVF